MSQLLDIAVAFVVSFAGTYLLTIITPVIINYFGMLLVIGYLAVS